MAQANEVARDSRAGGVWNDLLRFGLREAGVAVALVLIVIFFSLTAPYFATPENFLKIFVQIGINTVLSSGMTFVILTGGIDLSVGSVLALCTVVGALTMTNPSLPFAVSIPLALLGCMGVGGLCGFVNGFVVEQWKVPSFIVTLGMLNVASGAARVVSNNATITGLPQPFIDFGNLIVFGVFPSIFLVAIGVILIGWFVLKFHCVRTVHLRDRHQRGGGAALGPQSALLQDRGLHHQRSDRRRRGDGLSVAAQRRQPDRRSRL